MKKNKYKFLKVDAFTKEAFKGNPCAIVLDADSIDDTNLQNIASEMNLSETAFLMKSKNCDFKARYFTPKEEIPMAGHPTIALSHTLLELGLIQLKNKSAHFTLELKAGIIHVKLYQEFDEVYIQMQQLKPKFLTHHKISEIAPLFSLNQSDFVDSLPIQTISTGTPQLMVYLKSEEALFKAELNINAYKKYKEKSDFFSPHLFYLNKDEAYTKARHFGLPPDTFEDPFTGSASGAMACYLWKYNQLKTPLFIAYQGENLNRAGQAKLEIFGPQEDIEYITITGQATTIMEGYLYY